MKLQHVFPFLFHGVDASEVLPPCREHDCVPLSVYTAPGIGLGLSLSSRTVATHLHNGTVLDLALVRATSDYTALMARLVALPEAPPSLNRWEKMAKVYQQEAREAGNARCRDLGRNVYLTT